jgi:hypothetical protein
LIENLPSPPLEKLLKGYIPTFPSKADGFEAVPSVPSEMYKAIKEAVEERNKVVHGRSVDLDRQHIEAMLICVLDLLYFLDYHAGHGWAKDIPLRLFE